MTIRTSSYTSYDTYARHLIVAIGPLKVDLAIVSMDDEGMDQRLFRALFSWGQRNRMIEAGIDRDHTINYASGAVTTTRWHATARTYAWSWPRAETRDETHAPRLLPPQQRTDETHNAN